MKRAITTALASGFLLLSSLGAHAQIATPLLDPGFPALSAAATGWRTNSSVDLIYVSAEGDITAVTPAGDVKIGEVAGAAAAEGEEDSQALPGFIGVFKADTFAAELYGGLGDGTKTDMAVIGDLTTEDLSALSLTPSAGLTGLLSYEEESTTRVNLSYVIDEFLSLGAGYRQVATKSKEISTALGYAYATDFGAPSTAAFTGLGTEESEVTETGTSLVASWKIAELFYLAGGMESVNWSGSVKSSTVYTFGGATVHDTGEQSADFVANSWTNTILGLGFLSGEPGETQLRAEYSMILSPESKKENEGTKVGKNHRKTTSTFANFEIVFSNILLSYQSENSKIAELDGDGEEMESTTTLMGLGWIPEESFTVTAYAYNSAVTQKTTNSEVKMDPSGLRLVVGWNF